MPDWNASNKQLGGGIPIEIVSTFNDFGNLMQFGNCSVYSNCRRNVATVYFKDAAKIKKEKECKSKPSLASPTFARRFYIFKRISVIIVQAPQADVEWYFG